MDTAGFVHSARGIEAAAQEQAARAIDGADLIVLVVDARTGITEEDAHLARRLRRGMTPTLVVANKVDSDADLPDAASFLRLGLGEPFPVSALHGKGTGDLLDRIIDLLPDAPRPTGAPPEPRFAIVGRPNVGKSSIFNRLVGEVRSVVSEEAGTTRDSVDTVVDWADLGRVRFVDTAGMRRGQRVRGVEYFSYLRATETVERSDIALLVLDGSDGLTSEDKRIAKLILDAGRGLLIVANKWDLVEEKDRTFKLLGDEVTMFARASAVRTSALTGQGIPRLPHLLMDLHLKWSSRTPTSTINRILQQAQRERPTPRSAGTLHYASQVAAGPPQVVVFGGARPPDAGYQRYLENRFRKELRLEGVPIRVRYRPRQRRKP
jgi:GTP-binding protein